MTFTLSTVQLLLYTLDQNQQLSRRNGSGILKATHRSDLMKTPPGNLRIKRADVDQLVASPLERSYASIDRSNDKALARQQAPQLDSFFTQYKASLKQCNYFI
ncbi:uncharacterized protein PHALS_15498 [Plasmopara halstedii]|uniref:Uncharacterized protein n=1 Tax=Plasmopara halstedii TaxID=4781 RepID=A0A0P1A598_PLAHL|nr:uncharacterized protein PHALS_15498 [Plasmopara halstedii]CEG35548.1 hypothetical protein PHALS_15498 [Plasmopara halstedii]|eukprot:XP_024571917.1 hypothetical protein PHALS_15498 [Plasmopara halstedii]